MNKKLLVILTIAFGTVGFSQSSKTVSPKEKNQLNSESTSLDTVTVSNGVQKNIVNQDQQTYPIKLSAGTKPTSTTSSPQQKTAPVLTRTISDIEAEIETIQNKKAYVDADPTRKAEAEADGSYQEMLDRLAYLESEKQKHLNK